MIKKFWQGPQTYYLILFLILNDFKMTAILVQTILPSCDQLLDSKCLRK